MIFSCFTQKLKENVGGLLGGGGGGATGMLDPSQIIGGPGPPAPPTPSSYAYDLEMENSQYQNQSNLVYHKF